MLACALQSNSVRAQATVSNTQAQSNRGFTLLGEQIEKRVHGVLSLMGYSLTPDVTTGSLSISDTKTSNPAFNLTTLGGGFTLSQDTPLYLEGTAAFNRYDPTFVASDGVQSRSLPVKWSSFSATGGIGWDFPITAELKFRPMLNISIGQVASDVSVASRILDRKTNYELDFLERGKLNAIGYGGSLMLDYEHYREDYEIDVEVRYTQILLRTTDATANFAQGSAVSRSAGFWSRWRAPTGLTLLDRPLRYVLEATHSRWMGDEAKVLGITYLTALGAGIEIDSSKYPVWITRTRLVARYVFGSNVTGVSIGLACSF
jgi:hypothetical protein